jgi:hypothetical protein
MMQFKRKGRCYRGVVVETSKSGLSVKVKVLQDERIPYGASKGHFRELPKRDRFTTNWIQKKRLDIVY